MSGEKVLIVDDHAMFREGLRLLFDKQGFACDLLEADSCAGALRLLGQHVDVDWVLLDLGLPDKAGIDALDLLRKRHEGVPVVVLSGSEDRALVLECINRGAMGFIAKSSDSAVLINALRVVFAGGVYLPPALFWQAGPVQAPAAQPPLVAMPDPFASLGMSKRQIQVLELVVQGLSNKLISDRLDLAEATVKSHVAAGLRALNVKNRTQAVVAVARMGRLAGANPRVADTE